MSGAITRRDLLRSAALAGAAVAAASPAAASGVAVPRPDLAGMLYDATKCTGCKACVAACNAAGNLPPDTGNSGGLHQMPLDLNARTRNIVKLYREPGTGAFSFVKRQCMHCIDPACVSGCPFGALHKEAQGGAVRWTGWKCIGCRYCQVACPFQVPQFEWDRFNPRIVKCELCRDRRPGSGEGPACASVCPTGATIAGTREKMLDEAKGRVAAHPGRYAGERVYGETDGGGTQVLLLAAVPYRKLGLPELPAASVPQYANRVSSVLFRYLSGPLIAYGVLAAVIRRNWKRHQPEQL